MKLPRRNSRSSTEIAMTPLIDVVFLLMIFFVCTASFQVAENILASNLLATGSTPSDVEFEPLENLERVVVKLAAEQGRLQWIVNDRPYADLAAVRDVLRAVAEVDPGLPVVLDAAGNVPLGDVIDLYDVSRLAGFDKVQFAAKGE